MRSAWASGRSWLPEARRRPSRPVRGAAGPRAGRTVPLVTSIRGLPLGVRAGLQDLFGSPVSTSPSLAKNFRPAGSAAIRICRFAGWSPPDARTEHCLVYYERGGSPRTWRVALFHWTPAATRLEWGGVAPGSLVTFDDVRRFVLSGAINSPAGVW